MPPPGSFKPLSFRQSDRSSNNVATTTTTTTTTSSSIPAQLTLSTRSLNRRPEESRNVEALPVLPMSNSHHPTHLKQNMSSDMLRSNGNNKISAAASSDRNSHAKLHKRGVPSIPSLPGLQSQSSAAFVPHGASTPDVTSTPNSQPLSGVPKIKPYLRKMSTSKEDQGMIDLSKSRRENERLAGLGIQEFAPKTVADVSFTHNKRGQQHGRTISNSSNNSSGSGNYRATQAFVHPMAKTPRPYTPPSGMSYANSLNEEEANESDDVVEDDFRLGNGFRSRRSMSVSSTPQNVPTPLSQSHTASELGLVPKVSSASQSNLSLASSDKSSGRKAHSRRNTELSQEYIPSPTSRTSFDKAFSFVARKSDPTDPQSRDDLIRAARIKFEEKEASKDRRYEKEASRRRELEARRERKRSDATPPLKPALKQPSPEKRRRKSSAAQAGAERRDDFRAMSYDDYRPAHAASLPTFGTRPGESEKSEYRPRAVKAESRPDGNWMRFSTWLQTRMLSCGGSRA